MAGGPDIVALPSIAALPPTTARQIGSGQVLVDPSSVVKELIDNALDARAKSIFVDIAANTIDSIQVKDDGHGIPAEDRPLVCRRSCTSKIRDFHDLREVGGKWLGFRGEALSSMAEMSSSMCVTTRVEGEPVAVKLKYGWDGELASVEHDSHPVGTTVKVTKLFDFIPVRKQAASKNSANLLAKIRRLMQAYALARPTIRFRLRVLKAKNNNGDFVYAPRADANVKDAALKVIGKDCALQCDWTVLEADGFEVHAFLPKPGATGPKIAHRGAFVSIDARPVSSSRGTIKQIVAAFRDRLRKSNPSLAGVKDPFFCLNITCPPDSYDPNIEPAKDDVMFDNSAMVIGVVDKLLKAFYPESSQDVQDAELPTSAQHQYEPPPQQLLSCSGNSIVAPEDEPTSPIEEPLTNPMQALPRWRSSMYGIDEDDLEFLQEDPAPVFEEEEGLRAAEISNPWTIARMNTTIKTKQAVNNKQLLSPAKSRGGTNSHVESSSPAVTPRRPCSAVPLTPQTSSRMKMTTYPSDAELGCSIQQAPQPSSESGNLGHGAQDVTTNARRRYEFRTSPIHTGMSPTRGSNGTELKESLPGTQVFQPARRQKHSMINDGPRLPTKNSSIPRRPVLSAAERTAPNQLHSIDNSDIRDFFGRIGDARGVSHTQRSLMTSINPEPSIHQLRGRSPPLFSGNVPQRNAPADGLSRASSAEPQPRSKRVRDDLQLDDDRGMIDESRDVAHRASSAGSQMSMSLDQRSTSIRDSLSAQNEHDTRLEPRKPSRSFRTYHDVFPQSPTPRLSSTRTKHPFISQQPRQTSVPPATHHPENRAEEIEAYFRSHEQQHTSSPSHHTNASPRQGPRIALSHETPRKARRPRHRTTDALERTQSSPLALQRPPKGSDMQNLVFPLAISITAIVHCSRALDMRRDCPEWGSACEDTYGGFDERVVEKEIMAWAVKLDALLCRRYERMDGVDTRRDIHEGVWRALDTRRETSDVMLGAEGVERGIVDGGVEVFENHVFGDGGDDASVVVQQPGVNDDDCDFDMEQFVDLTVENERQGMGTAGEGGAEVVKGEYDEDIEDEMLMDL